MASNRTDSATPHMPEPQTNINTMNILANSAPYALPGMTSMYNIISRANSTDILRQSNMDVLASASLRDMQIQQQPPSVPPVAVYSQEQPPRILRPPVLPITMYQLNEQHAVVNRTDEHIQAAASPLLPAASVTADVMVEDFIDKFNNVSSVVRNRILDRIVTNLSDVESDKISFSLVQKQHYKTHNAVNKSSWNPANGVVTIQPVPSYAASDKVFQAAPASVSAAKPAQPSSSSSSSYMQQQQLQQTVGSCFVSTPIEHGYSTGTAVNTNMLPFSIAKHTVPASTQTEAPMLNALHCSSCQCPSRVIQPKPYVCDFCTRRFCKWRTLKIHMRKHTGDDIHRCPTCRKVFQRKELLQLHRKTHANERPFMCQVCNKGFSTKSTMRSHSILHTGLRPYQCRFCNKTFTRKTNLHTHEKLHTGDAPYQCEICSKKFIRKDYLLDHQQATHTEKKLFACEICGREFAWKNAFKKHMQQHSETTQYPCEQCGKVFPHKANLRMHIRIHSGVKPHACQYCSKRFMQRQDLQRHEMIHTGLKPFACVYCSKTFVRTRDLKIHEKTHMTKLQQTNAVLKQ